MQAIPYVMMLSLQGGDSRWPLGSAHQQAALSQTAAIPESGTGVVATPSTAYIRCLMVRWRT